MNRIDVLPDDVLLRIFDFCVYTGQSYGSKTETEAWQSLVHVCRRWRSLVFESPRRLNLRLHCTTRTPAKGTLDVWPPLPLIVTGYLTSSFATDNLFAAFRQSNRLCQVDLILERCDMNVLAAAALQVPFPKLTDLCLKTRYSVSSAIPIPIPDSFLGGSVPSLRRFKLYSIPFPGFPKLLSSATHLVSLRLSGIPPTGCISPEAMAGLLSVLSSLESLILQLQYPPSRSDRQRKSLPPLVKRSILPALKRLDFSGRGVTQYLEELVTHIDAPELDETCITYLDQLDSRVGCAQLAQFINRTPTLRKLDEARVQFGDGAVRVKLQYRISQSGPDHLEIAISREPDWQLPSIKRVCNSSFHPISTVVDLYIEHRYRQLFLRLYAGLWSELLLPFTAVKNLYLSKGFALDIATALEELCGDRITQVLPSLQNIFVEGFRPSGPFETNIEQFVTVRQLSGHPIAISNWEKD